MTWKMNINKASKRDSKRNKFKRPKRRDVKEIVIEKNKKKNISKKRKKAVREKEEILFGG